MQTIWGEVEQNLSRAQERQRTQADQRRRKVDFVVSDYVMLSTKHLKTNQPSRKIGFQALGPFEVVEQPYPNTFRLRLPPGMLIHPVVNTDRLRKASRSKPLLGQKIERSPTTANTPEVEPEFEVDFVRASRRSRDNRVTYQVKWKGYDVDNR